VKKLLPLLLVLALALPATAINKDGLLSAGANIFYWLPMGNFGEAYEPWVGFGAKVGYGLSESFEVLGQAWYGLADFNDKFWGQNYWDDEATYFLFTFAAGARYNFSPYSQFDPYIQATGGYYMWATYKEVGLDTDDDGIIDTWQNETVVNEDSRRFGINLKAGGEFFTSNNMAVDVGVDWNSVFDVDVPEPNFDEDGLFDGTYDIVNETVNILTFGIGLNLYF
jgi:hypothetical protein